MNLYFFNERINCPIVHLHNNDRVKLQWIMNPYVWPLLKRQQDHVHTVACATPALLSSQGLHCNRPLWHGISEKMSRPDALWRPVLEPPTGYQAENDQGSAGFLVSIACQLESPTSWLKNGIENGLKRSSELIIHSLDCWQPLLAYQLVAHNDCFL